jgi:hypothetical protein
VRREKRNGSIVELSLSLSLLFISFSFDIFSAYFSALYVSYTYILYTDEDTWKRERGRGEERGEERGLSLSVPLVLSTLVSLSLKHTHTLYYHSPSSLCSVFLPSRAGERLQSMPSITTAYEQDVQLLFHPLLLYKRLKVEHGAEPPPVDTTNGFSHRCDVSRLCRSSCALLLSLG